MTAHSLRSPKPAMKFYSLNLVMNALFVFLGGGAGSVLRYLVGLWIGSTAFPWATFAVNAVGRRFGWSEALRLSLTVGLCGGFTTFSTFSKDSLALIDSGSYGLFALYAAGSVALGIAATALGLWLAK